MANRLWTVTPRGQPPAAHTPWTTLRVAHTAHNLDHEVGLFSIVKWASFRLSRFRRNGSSGPLFDDQVGLFSVDKNICSLFIGQRSVRQDRFTPLTARS